MEAKDLHDAEAVVRHDLDSICANLEEEFARLAGKKLLITGGGGFLGYYLVQAALHHREPISVTVYDNFMRGMPEWLKALDTQPRLSLVKHDIIKALPADMDDFDYIIHAASIASPIYYRKFPVETMDANVHGVRQLLDYCRAREAHGKPVAGMLFFSSSEIYGDPSPDAIPTSEEYNGFVSCTGPRACYDESKRYGETLCVNFARQYGTPVRIARPFNNYGPGLKITDRRALPDFARDVLNGKDIVLLSDGTPTRTFCYIADAIAGYFKILVRGRNGEAYNIGVEAPEISVAELGEHVVEAARKLFDYTGRVVRKVSSDKDYLVDNPNRRCPSIDKARAELGYNPSVGIEEGLERSLLWYADNRVAEDA